MLGLGVTSRDPAYRGCGGEGAAYMGGGGGSIVDAPNRPAGADWRFGLGGWYDGGGGGWAYEGGGGGGVAPTCAYPP